MIGEIGGEWSQLALDNTHIGTMSSELVVMGSLVMMRMGRDFALGEQAEGDFSGGSLPVNWDYM